MLDDRLIKKIIIIKCFLRSIILVVSKVKNESEWQYEDRKLFYLIN